MKPRSLAICLFAVTCALSAGCSTVYVKDGLGEEHRRDVPDLEGRWSGTDRSTGKSGTFNVIREGLGRYRVVHPETGDFVDAETGDRTSVRVETFEVGNQLFVEPAVTTTGGDPPFPFPLLLKAELGGGRLQLAALKSDFLNLRFVVYRCGVTSPRPAMSAPRRSQHRPTAAGPGRHGNAVVVLLVLILLVLCLIFCCGGVGLAAAV